MKNLKKLAMIAVMAVAAALHRSAKTCAAAIGGLRWVALRAAPCA